MSLSKKETWGGGGWQLYESPITSNNSKESRRGEGVAMVQVQ